MSDSLTSHAETRSAFRGQSMVEFALILPIFALLLVMAIDFGRVYFTYIQLTNSAREAANYGAGSPTDTAEMEERALAEKNAQDQGGEDQASFALSTECTTPAGVVIDCADSEAGAGPGNHLTVTVTQEFNFLTPIVSQFLGNFTMRATATSTVLGLVAGTGGSNPTCTTAPTASFSVVVTSGRTVHADPSASTPITPPCAISGYNWNWGDGTEPEVGTATGLDHTYQFNGTYQVTLTVTNQVGTNSQVKPITVPQAAPPTCVKPIAAFHVVSHNQTGGSGNNRQFTYIFDDDSTVADPVNCPITNWLWTFQDGIVSNAQNPIHVYVGRNNEQFTTTLVVTNAGGASIPVSHTD
jgi:PKD repeat protein